MSLFIQGAVKCLQAPSPDWDGLAWKVAEAGLVLKIHVQIGPNVKQECVRHTLESCDLVSSTHLPFIVTSSPVRTVSDGLLDLEDSQSGGGPAIIESMNRFGQWLAAVAAMPGVESIDVITSEGFDTHAPVVPAKPSEAAERIACRTLAEGELPSLWQRVSS